MNIDSPAVEGVSTHSVSDRALGGISSHLAFHSTASAVLSNGSPNGQIRTLASEVRRTLCPVPLQGGTAGPGTHAS